MNQWGSPFSHTTIWMIDLLPPTLREANCLLHCSQSYIFRSRSVAGGSMRVILIPSVMLLCAAPIFAQGTPAEVQINNPAPLMSRQQTRQPPSPFGKPAPTGVDVPPETPVATLD